MRILVATANYPGNKTKAAMMFAHVRNLYYVTKGIDVTVLNFSATKSYQIDGIPVITLEQYKQSPDVKYDCLICHAANIRNHYRFLKRYQESFGRIIFIFHGHEVLKSHYEYPEPYAFQGGAVKWKRAFRRIYDILKLQLWHSYYLKLAEKSEFVFVSQWLERKFFQYTKIEPSQLEGHCHVIHNSVGAIFETANYDWKSEKKFDFLIIRSQMDSPKYGIDIFRNIAQAYPQYKFLAIGKGRYFQYNQKPDNIQLLNKQLTHEEMLSTIDQVRCALMPTREDTQGVMSCELATYGIPLITSDIEVCQEIFDGLPNVELIHNETAVADCMEAYARLREKGPCEKITKYFADNTIQQEVLLIQQINDKD